MTEELNTIQTVDNSPFKHLIMTIGELPTSFVDSMTYYELLAWLCNYVENTVIPAVNNNAEALEELQDKFVELKDYVDNYFDNLDVQDEINQKLDEMAEDGTLTNLIKAYIDPIQEAFEESINVQIEAQDEDIETFKTQISDTVSTQNSHINSLTNMVNSVTSGSPKGVYATLTALTTADPDHDYIYVVIEDGKWYYYNNGWTAGGVYQSAEGVMQYELTGNLFDKTTEFENTLISPDSGNTTPSTTYNTSDYIDVVEGSKYTFLSRYRVFTIFASDNTVVSYDTDGHNAPYTITIPAGGAKIRFSYFNQTPDIMFVAGEVTERTYAEYTKKEVDGIDFSDTNYADMEKKVNDTLYCTPSINLVNPNEIVSGVLQGNGTLVSSTQYVTTGYIPLKENTNYTVTTRTRWILYYDEYYNVSSNVQSTSAGFVVENTNASYMRLSFYSADSNYMVYEGTTSMSYVPYERKINQNIGLTNKMKQELEFLDQYGGVSNILNGKKLTVCGDSFSAYTNASFDSGPYVGLNKVWSYLIGLRNNMTITNMAVSGSTMSVDGGEQVQFSDSLYTTIPSDSDYIIIKYGINDLNKNIPVGTINDNTNTTFYGAWNVVMNYIIQNHPTAKIGIIVTNGLIIHTDEPNNSNYANAIIQIAKKYGIPTLNEWNDPNVPLLIRTGRTDVLQSIRDARRNTFRVSADNTHENYICQEYESYIIENFLRSL